jgi:hypothetical protein
MIAKHNRERKKEEVRELQDSVVFLKRKNKALENELALRPSFITERNCLLTVAFDAEFTLQIMTALDGLRERAGSESTAFFVVNAASYFFPVICASPALVQLTGYPMHEIVGQNCGFLSGNQTSRYEVIKKHFNCKSRAQTLFVYSFNTIILFKHLFLTY